MRDAVVPFDVWLTYVSLVAILVVSPGPSVLLVVAHGLRHGIARTGGTICGDLTANLLQMLGAGLGMGAILATWPRSLEVVRWIGVAYLASLGIAKWAPGIVAATPPRQHQPAASACPSRREAMPASVRRLFLVGFAVSASNPKAILFFAGLFPLFLDAASPRTAQLITLGLTFLILDGAALWTYTLLAARIGQRLEAHRRLADRFAGSVLVVAACLLAVEQM